MRVISIVSCSCNCILVWFLITHLGTPSQRMTSPCDSGKRKTPFPPVQNEGKKGTKLTDLFTEQIFIELLPCSRPCSLRPPAWLCQLQWTKQTSLGSWSSPSGGFWEKLNEIMAVDMCWGLRTQPGKWENLDEHSTYVSLKIILWCSCCSSPCFVDRPK